MKSEAVTMKTPMAAMAARELVSSASSVKILWNTTLFVRTVIFSGDTLASGQQNRQWIWACAKHAGRHPPCKIMRAGQSVAIEAIRRHSGH